MDDPLLVEVPHRPNQLRKDPLQQRRNKQLPLGRCDVEQITTSRIRQHQNRPRRLDVEGLEVDERGMVYDLEDLELALQTHLNPLLAGAAPGPVLADLDGHERLPVRLRLRVGTLGVAVHRLDLARRQHHLAERALAERLELPPPPPLVVVPVEGLVEL